MIYHASIQSYTWYNLPAKLKKREEGGQKQEAVDTTIQPLTPVL
jgi:hypothetical protein